MSCDGDFLPPIAGKCPNCGRSDVKVRSGVLGPHSPVGILPESLMDDLGNLFGGKR